MQSVPITTNGVSSNPAQDEAYSIQHYVIKFVRSMIFSGWSGFFHQYNWNIFESGIKHDNPNPSGASLKYFQKSWPVTECW